MRSRATYHVKRADLAAHMKALDDSHELDDRLRLELISARVAFDQGQRAVADRRHLALVREHLTYQMRP